MVEIKDQYGRDITALLQSADAPNPSGLPTGVSEAPPVSSAPPQTTEQAAPTKLSELAQLVLRIEALEANIVRLVGHIFGA